MLAATQPLAGLNICRPTLLLDARRARRNIERMAGKAAASGVRFRPHFKTHQSAAIGNWFREFGVEAITVSSLDMARYFARHGWKDITVAFPVNLREQDKIAALAGEVDLHLLVDSAAVVDRLDRVVPHPVRLWIKVDVGTGRAGIPWSDTERIQALARRIRASRTARFTGLLAHSGHSYDAASRDAILAIHRAATARLVDLRRKLQGGGLGPCALSIGDTPCCSLVQSFTGVDEIRPGNFVFYDLTQARLGACAEEDIAVSVACPVASVYPERRRIVLYAGAVHLSKDWLTENTGRRVHGYLAPWAGDSWGAADTRAALVSLSQEHGVVEADADLCGSLSPGDLVVVLPVHSCLTSDLYEGYLTLQGERLARTQSNSLLAL
jgi:D-serine deaminase-like pyridoxal phosphate-dependent protein